MNNVILSTRYSNDSYKNMATSVAVLTCLLGIAVAIGGFFLMSQSDEGVLILGPILGAIMIVEGIITGTIRNRFAETYVDCYEDKMVGQGIQNLGVLAFSFKFNQIVNVSVDGINIYIHTNSGKYQIISDKETAMRVFDYYHENKGDEL